MKNLRYLFFALAAACLSSCDNLTEEIHVNADGSGEYVFYTDMIPGITRMASEMAVLFQDSLAGDSLGMTLEESIWKDFPDVLDSVIDHDDMIPDSVLSRPEVEDLVKDLQFFMEGGKSKGYVHMGFRYRFEKLEDLEEMLRKMEDNQHNSGAGGGMMPGLDEMRTDIEYEFNGSSFRRKTTFLTKPNLQETDLEMLRLFMAEAKMRTIVYVPRRLKKINGASGRQTSDTSAVFEYSMLDYILGKASSDFEVLME